MNAAAQAVHVARKDARRLRWLLLAYAGLVTWASLIAAGILPEGMGALPPAAIVVPVAAVTFALLIFGDPPWRSDAFWASRPLEPLAVLAGKLLVMLVILLGLALIGQFVALTAHGIDAAATLQLLATSLRPALLWLLAAGILAALLPDFRSFLAACVLLLAVSSVGTMLLLSVTRFWAAPVFGFSFGTPAPASTLAGFAAPAALLLALAYAYHSRSRRRAAAAAGAALLLLLLIGAVRGWDGPVMDDAPAPAAQPIRVTAQLEPAPATGLVVSLALTGEPATGYIVRWPVVYLETAPGARELLDSHSRSVVPGQLPPPPLQGIRWSASTEAERHGGAIHAELTPRQRRLLERGAFVHVEGWVEVREFLAAVDMPLLPGARLAHQGSRFHIADVVRDDDGRALELHTRTIVGSQPFFDVPERSARFALFDPAAGEALELLEGDATFIAPSGLVLPGVRAWRSRAWLRSTPAPDVIGVQVAVTDTMAAGAAAAPAPDRNWTRLLIVPVRTRSTYRLEERVPVSRSAAAGAD